MNKLIAPVMFVAAFATVVVAVPASEGCSAAQKSAEEDIAKNVAKNAGPCLTECAIEKAFASKDVSQVAAECGVQCTGKAITDPNVIHDIEIILSGAKQAAAKMGVSAPADAGK